MNLVLTNQTTTPVPVLSGDEGGWAETATPGAPLTIDRPGTNDLIIGDKPSVSESIVEGLGTIAATVRKLLTLRRPSATPQSVDDGTLLFTIANHGPNSVRVLLGDGTSDVEVAAQATYSATAPGYIEVRELGVLQSDPNQKEAP